MIQAASRRPEFCASFVEETRSNDAEIQSVARKEEETEGSGNAFEFRFVNVFAKVERKST